jgi:hypothetical protein
MPACALCGTPAAAPFRAPPPETAPDLDLRPGEPTRSTLARWAGQCRGCSACAPDLALLPADAAELTRVPSYRALRSRFQRWAALVAGTPDEAEALLHAAWEADDLEDTETATALRRRAVAVWPEPADAEQVLRLVDVLRRAAMFDDAAARMRPLAGSADASTRQIAAFQRARIEARDTTRHLLSSALRPPARTPHVTHGRRGTGFWGRIFSGAVR